MKKRNEDVLVNTKKNRFFYYGGKTFICPNQGLVLPINRMMRVTTFAQHNNVAADVEDDKIIITHTINLNTDFKGMIHAVEVDGETLVSLYPEVSEPERIVLNPAEETQATANRLKVFFAITDEGFIFTTADAVEKTAMICMDTDGYVGSSDSINTRNIMTLKNLWPELGLKIRLHNGSTEIRVTNSQIVEFAGAGIICLHRNFSQELTVSQDFLAN